MARLVKIWGEGIPDVSPWELDSITESGSCVFALDPDAKYSGIFGYKASYDGANIVCYGSKGFTPQGEVYFGVRFKIDPGLTGVADKKIYLFNLECLAPTSMLTGITLELDGSGDPLQWSVYNRVGGFFNSSQNFTLGVWHYWLVFYRQGTGSDGGWIHKIDGIEIYNNLTHDVSPFTADLIRIGSKDQVGANPAAGSYIYYDDIGVDDSEPPGLPILPYSYDKKPLASKGLPIPFLDHVPKLFRDNPSPDLLALTGKMDGLLEAWGIETKELQHLYDPGRAHAAALAELEFMFQADFKGYETEREKRQKISFAVKGHKSRGLWQEDAKPKIDAIAGGDAQIFRGFSGDDWILVGDGLTPAAYYWAALGADGVDDELGIALIGSGDEVEVAGNIYIDVDNDSLTAQEVKNMVQELEADVVPAYIRVILGYVNVVGQFIEYARI